MAGEGRVTLIVNPAAGGAGGFLAFAESAGCAAMLGRRSLSLRVVETSAERGSGGWLAAEAAKDSALVVACGGDGTVHDTIQGLAGTQAAFGVVPLGTHNALARNMGLRTGRPVAALERLLGYRPVRVPLGEVTARHERRFFAAMCGCGPDGALAHAVAGARGAWVKRRFGPVGYPLLAAGLFVSRHWPCFEVEYRRDETSEWQRMRACAVLCSRVPDLGGVFGGLTRGSSLRSERLQVQAVRPPGHLSMAAWLSLSRLGVRHPLAVRLEVERIRCAPVAGAKVYAQADAEAIGVLPLEARVVKDALTMMLPAGGA